MSIWTTKDIPDQHGKLAVITGATGGLGYETALALAGAGATVILTGRNEAKGADALARIRKVHPNADIEFENLDLAELARIAAFAENFAARHEKIDILVNNAGVTHLPMAMEEVSEADFDRVFAVNMKAIFLTAKHLVPLLKANRAGAILNVASTAAVSPRPRLSWYNSSKGWLVTATKSMAIELAPFGVRVNAINPVAGETPLLKTFMGEDTPEMRAKFLATIPLGRFSQPEDMGNAACFLCSDEASMITGVAMEVDGGRCI